MLFYPAAIIRCDCRSGGYPHNALGFEPVVSSQYRYSASCTFHTVTPFYSRTQSTIYKLI